MNVSTGSSIGTDSSRRDDHFDDVDTDEENLNNPQDGNDENHDLPTVEEYKSNLTFRENSSEEGAPKSRAGLYTFLCLVLLLIIVTSIAIPVALRNKSKRRGNSTDKANAGGGSFTGNNQGPASNIMTARPATTPTSPPVQPPTMADLPRKDRALDYLVNYGITTRDVLNNPNSPQAKALNWIANNDAFKMDIPNFSGEGGGTPRGSSYADTRFAERWALAVFYYSTGGDKWTYNLNFLKPIDHCDWYSRFITNEGIIRQGVTECQMFAPKFNGERVSKIEIAHNKLDGLVPSEIKYFTNLQEWKTPFNVDMTTASSLDPFVGLAESLSHLEVQYCGISGTIPESFGDMKLLSFLGLGNNFFTGKIPQSFFGLTNLIVLGLDDNLLESPIAPFAKLNKLKKLYAEDNVISGEITQDMISGGWQSMVDLDLSVNSLGGPIPTNIWTMESLEVMDLHGNALIGQIPEIDAVHDNLFFFAVQDNRLEWRIPESINNLINLKHLDISANKMALPFPPTMSEMSNLVSLYTSINEFGEHPIPGFLAQMTDLKELSMKQNQLTGQIPAFIGGMTNLKVLDLDFNQLTGTIPDNFGQLSSLEWLMLNRNFLNGTLPVSFASLVEMDYLLLDGNNITGSAATICGNPAINLTVFSADCGLTTPEIECSCCSVCCHDDDPECNNFAWRINLDGIWEYDFERVVYAFSQEVLPVTAKEDYGNGGA